MEIGRFMDLSVDLEVRISDLYETIAERSGDEPIAARLRTLAKEEFDHANAIRRVKSYIEETPGEFFGPAMSPAEVRKGLEEITAFRGSLDATAMPLSDQLRKMLDLEKRFEKIHMEALATIKEPILKRLFVKLSKDDQSHVLVLLGLIESLGEAI